MPASPKSILAATDLEIGSDVIVTSAARIAARCEGELHLIHSLDLPWVPSEEVVRRSGLEEQIASAEDALEAQVERALLDELQPTSRHVAIDSAHKAILDRAKEVAADLIVLGPHRGGAISAQFVGTTANRVIRVSDVPCLVLEKPIALPPRRIGVPNDYSPPAQAALQLALSWVMALDSTEIRPEVRVVHVGLPLERMVEPRTEDLVTRPALERELEVARAEVPGSEALDIGLDVLWSNNAAGALSAWVNERGIDLLVLGTHGRGPLERLLVGSVAAGVLRRVPCPLLLVPPQAEEGSEGSD